MATTLGPDTLHNKSFIFLGKCDMNNWILISEHKCIIQGPGGTIVPITSFVTKIQRIHHKGPTFLAHEQESPSNDQHLIL